MLRIILCGCCGRMGKSVSQKVSEGSSAKIVAGVDIASSGGTDYPVYSNILDIHEEADVIVDFSHHGAVGAISGFAAQRSLPVVFCTTGYNEEELEVIKSLSTKTAVFRSANMSLGVNVLLELCRKAAKVLGDSFDIEITEMHHNQKLDAPSGTALLLADGINEALDNKAEYVYDRHLRRERRPKNEIGIHSLRGGTVVGEHSVIFAGNNETLTLSHSATSREVFAQGALKAAAFVAGKAPGMYNMDDLIKESLSKA